MNSFLQLILKELKFRFSQFMSMRPFRYQSLFERTFIPTFSLFDLLIVNFVCLVVSIK